MSRLPFSVLRRVADGEEGYLASRLPVFHTAALGLRRHRSGGTDLPQDGIRLLAFADAPADGSSANAAPLPGARREVAQLSEMFPEAQVFVGGQATEERARRLAPRAHLLHFATHAAVDTLDALDSYLQLAPSASQLHTGRLEAWEVFAHLRLDADLVVLSGCETGGGEATRGEGLLGLTRAFQYAGARSVVATLWPVSDEYSQRLVVELYHRLSAGQSKDRALQAAQTTLIEAGAHPFHWAAFQLHGDWRANDRSSSERVPPMERLAP